MVVEIWKDIPEFEGEYQASTLGRIRSLKTAMPRVLKPHPGQDGYLKVNLYKEGKQFPMTVHRLIGLTFIENPENKPTVNHINMIKTDNRVENLEWNTKAEQNEYKANKENKKGAETKLKVKCIQTEMIFESSAAAAHWVIEQGLTTSPRVGYVAERIRFAARGDIYGRKTAFSYNWEFVKEGD